MHFRNFASHMHPNTNCTFEFFFCEMQQQSEHSNNTKNDNKQREAVLSVMLYMCVITVFYLVRFNFFLLCACINNLRQLQTTNSFMVHSTLSIHILRWISFAGKRCVARKVWSVIFSCILINTFKLQIKCTVLF